MTLFATFHLQDHMFALPAHEVLEIARGCQVRPVPLACNAIDGLINLRGRILTGLDLRQLLGLEASGWTQQNHVLIVEHEQHAYALRVDKVGDILDIDEKSLDTNPGTIPERFTRMTIGAFAHDSGLILLLNAEFILGEMLLSHAGDL